MIADKVKELEQENIDLKAQIAELEDICGGRAGLPMDCEYCENFYQHYIRTGGGYYPTYDGHCVAGRTVKKRKVHDTCKSFVKKRYGKNKLPGKERSTTSGS